MSGERGSVLVTALVLVAALAGAAVLLMQQAEGARLRQATAQEAGQAELYLDAAEALAIRMLETDRRRGGPDHLAEPWTAPFDLAADRGRIGGALSDAQGLFNLNWLAEPGRQGEARLALDRLTAALGLPSTTAARIARRIAPVQGNRTRPLDMLDQLYIDTGLGTAELAVLAPYVAALPASVRLNVNTAPLVVLQAVLGDLDPAQVAGLYDSIRRQPFTNSEEFVGAVLVLLDADDTMEVTTERFTVQSAHFILRARASLGQTVLTRETLLSWRDREAAFAVAHRRATGR